VSSDVVPDGDHVTRLCSRAQLNEDGWPEATAFILKPNEPYLSVNWLEHLGIEDRQGQVAEVLRVLRTKRDVRASAKLALLNVGGSRAAVQAGTTDRLEIEFRHEPEDEDSSHSGIYNLPLADTTIEAAEQLAMAVLQVFPVS
jgi:hypothetical protein